MSEKRFYITDTGLGLDNESDEMYSFGDEEDFCRLFDKLNEQQATIDEQKIKIELLMNMKYHKCTNLMENGLGETKPYYCKGDYIWLNGNGNISSENRQEFGDEYHYDRWIKEIKKYIDNEDFEYNEEFIIKFCLSYTLQSLRNDEDLKRFRWNIVNDNKLSDKTFEVLSGGFDEDGNPLYLIKDKDIGFEGVGDFEICKKMIEQQATIIKLKELNDDKGKRIISLIRTNKTLKEENEQLKKRKQY